MCRHLMPTENAFFLVLLQTRLTCLTWSVLNQELQVGVHVNNVLKTNSDNKAKLHNRLVQPLTSYQLLLTYPVSFFAC